MGPGYNVAPKRCPLFSLFSCIGDLMLYACATRFDVIRNFKKFLVCG